MSISMKYLFLLTLLLSAIVNLSGPGTALAQSDDVDADVQDMEIEEEDEMEVEDEEEEEPVTVPDSLEDSEDGEVLDEDDEDEEKKVGPHPDASTTLIFTNRQNNEFTAGEVVHSLMGFSNEADFEFIVTGIEASFRYPQDFSYFIQNFSMVHYETYVMPQTQMSFVYSFMPSESFYARPFGLTVNIYYRDTEGELYVDAVFNDTINIVEVEEGILDGETFFMYVFMVSGISLLMFIIHYVYTTTVRKSGSTSKRAVETGTQNKDDIDYQWLPPGAIPGTPKKSPRASPRKTKK